MTSQQRQPLRLALVQCNPTVGAIEANTEMVLRWAQQACAEQADLVLFPELVISGYPPEDLLLREEFHQRTEAALTRLCEQAPCALLLGVTRKRPGQGLPQNCALLIDQGRIVFCYAKQELPNYSVFDEMRYFEPGTESGVVVWRGYKLGLSVCEDIWVESPSQQLKQDQAELILNLNASPFALHKFARREQVLEQRFTETGLPIIYLNQVGGQDELVFDGRSLVRDNAGQTLLQMEAFNEQLALLTLEPDGSLQCTAASAAEMSETELLYQALICGTRDYVHKNGFKGAVIGLSGGIDSALVLALAADALGPEQVQAVMMPYHYTAQMSQEDAALQAEALGVEYLQIPIAPAVESFKQMLAEAFSGTDTDTTEENIQARSRGVTLMALSNKRGSIVLTTGNKSEMSVGYATLYGDMAGGYAPIRDVSKLRVYELARYRNSLSKVIPERVIERPPSAELAPGQLDQNSLPPYEILDPILELYIEQQLDIDAICAQGYARETVQKVVRLVDFSEYKRRQAAPGVRVTELAFGRDRRYPISSGFGRGRV